MKLTKSGPLIDREIDWLEEVLMKYAMMTLCSVSLSWMAS